MSEATSSRNPIRPLDLEPDRRGRRSGAVLPTDRARDGVQLVGRTTIFVLTASLCTAIVLTMLAVATTPIGWLATGLAALLGLVAPSAWQRYRHGPDRPAVSQLSPRWAEPVTRAAQRAERLWALADRSPAGPVAAHLERLAITADGYVVALHRAAEVADAASGGDPTIGDPELDADMGAIESDLAALVEAAERLQDAQRRHLQPSPLTELVAETERLTAALDGEIPPTVDAAEPPTTRRPGPAR